MSRLSKLAEALKVGPGMDKTSEMGPLVTKEHLEKAKSYVDLGVKEGAKLVVDGRNFKLQGYEPNLIVPPLSLSVLRLIFKLSLIHSVISPTTGFFVSLNSVELASLIFKIFLAQIDNDALLFILKPMLELISEYGSDF